MHTRSSYRHYLFFVDTRCTPIHNPIQIHAFLVKITGPVARDILTAREWVGLSRFGTRVPLYKFLDLARKLVESVRLSSALTTRSSGLVPLTRCASSSLNLLRMVFVISAGVFGAVVAELDPSRLSPTHPTYFSPVDLSLTSCIYLSTAQSRAFLSTPVNKKYSGWSLRKWFTFKIQGSEWLKKLLDEVTVTQTHCQ